MTHREGRGRRDGRGGRGHARAGRPVVVEVLERHLLGVAGGVGGRPHRDAALQPAAFVPAPREQFEFPALPPLALELGDLVVEGGVELLVDLRGDVGHDLGGVGLRLAVGRHGGRVVVVVGGAVLDLPAHIPVIRDQLPNLTGILNSYFETLAWGI